MVRDFAGGRSIRNDADQGLVLHVFDEWLAERGSKEARLSLEGQSTIGSDIVLSRAVEEIFRQIHNTLQYFEGFAEALEKAAPEGLTPGKIETRYAASVVSVIHHVFGETAISGTKSKALQLVTLTLRPDLSIKEDSFDPECEMHYQRLRRYASECS